MSGAVVRAMKRSIETIEQELDSLKKRVKMMEDESDSESESKLEEESESESESESELEEESESESELDENLIDAARKGDLEMIRKAACEGVNLDAKRGKALDTAMTYGKYDAAKLLVELGARASVCRGNIFTMPLVGNNIDVCKWLLSVGAKVSAKEVPISSLEIFKLLEQQEGFDASEVHKGFMRTETLSGNYELIEYVINKGAKVGDALFYAETEKMARLLVSKGANVFTTKRFDYHTLLDYHIWQGQYDIVRYLLTLGVKKTAKSVKVAKERDAKFGERFVEMLEEF